jgi:ParB family chromosome partitioning protein
MIHQLKCERQYFEAVAAGRKTFEVRQNDRDYQEGDFLALNEITAGEDTPAGYVYTGRSCLVQVDYILEDEQYLQPGYVCMAIKPCAIATLKDTCYKNGIYKVPTY